MDKNITIESWTFVNGKLILNEISPFESKWVHPSEDPVYQSMLNNIGIGILNPAYVEITSDQNKGDEYLKIVELLNKYKEYYALKNNLSIEDLNIKFINYGKTELVYVLTEKNGNRVTLLVKQPAVEFGKIKQEAENLLELKNIDKNVVAPIDYYKYEQQELYVTPYINQARCIASYNSWGMYIPEPCYRFESFSEEQEQIVTTCMIAKLISLYNFKEQCGIKSCKLGGGDFMLPKGWEKLNPTIENTLENLYLIAAREKIYCNFEEYVSIIKEEFSRTTICENQDNLVINLRGRVPMQMDNIEHGIELGLLLIGDNEIKKIYTKKK